MAEPKTRNRKQPEKGRKLNQLLALDFGTSGVKAVRLKKIKGRIALDAIDLLPPLNPDDGEPPDLPKSLFSYYTALSASMSDVQVRVFSELLSDEASVEEIVRENFGVDDEFRVAGRVVARGKARQESLVLGIAVPERTVQGCLEMFSSGAPAPRSLEVAGLASFSAFMNLFGKRTANQTVCLVDAGESFTFTAFFHRNRLKMISRVGVGSGNLSAGVQDDFGVDSETAASILAGGTIDVSSTVRRVYGGFFRQLSISREFVERQNKSSLSAVYLSGGLAASPAYKSALKEVLDLEPSDWNPFEPMDLPAGGLPESLKGQESRFTAAVGAALAGMEGA